MPGLPSHAAIRRKGMQAMATRARTNDRSASPSNRFLAGAVAAKRFQLFHTEKAFLLHLAKEFFHIRSTGLRRHIVFPCQVFN